MSEYSTLMIIVQHFANGLLNLDQRVGYAERILHIDPSGEELA
jgi:hypothetical protein